MGNKRDVVCVLGELFLCREKINCGGGTVENPLHITREVPGVAVAEDGAMSPNLQYDLRLQQQKLCLLFAAVNTGGSHLIRIYAINFGKHKLLGFQPVVCAEKDPLWFER